MFKSNINFKNISIYAKRVYSFYTKCIYLVHVHSFSLLLCIMLIIFAMLFNVSIFIIYYNSRSDAHEEFGVKSILIMRVHYAGYYENLFEKF